MISHARATRARGSRESSFFINREFPLVEAYFPAIEYISSVSRSCDARPVPRSLLFTIASFSRAPKPTLKYSRRPPAVEYRIEFTASRTAARRFLINQRRFKHAFLGRGLMSFTAEWKIAVGRSFEVWLAWLTRCGAVNCAEVELHRFF